jgi:glucan phosphorylase
VETRLKNPEGLPADVGAEIGRYRRDKRHDGRRELELYADPDGWARKAILNVAGSGKFSTDRTITEYAAAIWNAQPCPVS